VQQPKILLLNFNATEVARERLWVILKSSACADFQYLQESIDVADPASCPDRLSGTISRFNPDLIFLIPSQDLTKHVSSVVKLIKKDRPEVPIIVVIEAGESNEILGWLKLGVADFLTPPLKALDILPRVWHVLDQHGQEEPVMQRLKVKLGIKQLIGESKAFTDETKKIPLIAKCDATVLISGETGTGKEQCARAIHYLSPRAGKPFVPVNCGAIPVDLIENELFGHERGAFTGASTSELGLIYEADEGTLLLDEIDCLPLLAQVKLLRFLQEKEYRPLGSRKTYKANVRIMAASNTDLGEAVSVGRLRQDLYYRLDIIRLNLPPLRERREDILLLARHFLSKYASEFDKELTDFSPEAAQMLVLYNWPGNVRELEHVIERAVVLSEDRLIKDHDISLPHVDAPTRQESFQIEKNRMIEQFEKSYIQKLLLTCEGNITKAAQVAQKNRRAFWELVRKYRINARSFKSMV
jgi:two-component system response regulator GlrR